MKRSTAISAAVFLGIMSAQADITADWRIHMPFDRDVTRVLDTPGHVYFTSRCQEYRPDMNLQHGLSGRDIQIQTLFRYDKASDELMALNGYNGLSANTVSMALYNHQKKYLLIVYSDCNIDFLYDDGRVENCPSLKAASIPGGKKVNDITFDLDNNAVYLATSFGYVVLNDLKHEVKESRNYGANIRSAARVGDMMLMATDNGLLAAKNAEARFNLSDYRSVADVPQLVHILPLRNNECLLHYNGKDYNEYNQSVHKFSISSSFTTKSEEIFADRVIDVYPTPQGYTFVCPIPFYEVAFDGSMTRFNHDGGENYWLPAASVDGKTLWIAKDRCGLRSFDKSAGAWTLTRDYMLPNSTATFISTDITYSPAYGILAASSGVDLSFSNSTQRTPLALSGYKDSFWREYSPLWRSKDTPFPGNNFNGIAIDPCAPNYAWRGSHFNGLLRINLDDPSDLLNIGHPNSENAGQSYFVDFFPVQSNYKSLCRLPAPRFDNNGTMWAIYNASAATEDEGRVDLYYWTKEDRLASTTPGRFRPLKKLRIPEMVSSHVDYVNALTHPNNANIVVVCGMSNAGAVVIYDHNGTLDNTSDDRYVIINNPSDQDGGQVIFNAVNNTFEDPATGMLWLLTQRGVFTVNPVTAFDDPGHVNRIKVARNDGTSLADYLLNEVNTYNMAVDGEGRKWFFTGGAGVVCTTADGRQVVQEFNTSNSRIPVDDVYAGCWNPDNRSMMLATSQGLVEMFPSGAGTLDGKDSPARIFPNPVEPDFYGYVRIDNVVDGSLVKVTDINGNIIKELPRADGGSTQWDVTGLDNTRVKTGVYYILVSPGASGEGNTSVNKILVFN